MDRFAGEVQDLRTIARLHSLPTGSPERLASLPLRLSKDVRLRSDLTELVRSLQQRDPDLGLADALSLVLVAVGGTAALNRNRDLEEAVDLTGGFLASLGGWPGSDVEPLIDIDHPPDHDPRLDLSAVAFTAAPEADLPSSPHDEPADDAITSVDADRNDEHVQASNGAVTLSEITHALARLERGNLELRLHLDSIDQRICRMEPLLESVPHTTGPEGPPEPTPPPQRPGSFDRSADLLMESTPAQQPDRHPDPIADRLADAKLLHRSKSLADQSSPLFEKKVLADLQAEGDRQDAIKEQRRISLMSNFADPAPVAAAVRSPAPVQSPAPLAPATLPGPVIDPISHPRVGQPRRDRFAAARELPGVAAEVDPLYTAPEAELLGRQAPDLSASRPAVAADKHTQQLIPVPVEAAVPSLEPVFPAEAAPLYLSLEPQAAPEIAPDRRDQSPREIHRQGDHRPARVRPFVPRSEALPESTANVQLPQTFMAASAETPARSRTPWVAGLTAAAVLGAAGFLYVNGLPSAVSAWMAGNSTAASSDAFPQTASSADPSVAQSAAPESSGTASLPHSRSRAAAANPAPSGRVLGARESFNPSESVERTSGPTFVPGGIMDGYLISAPRPEYPKLAHLVGLHGKMSFEAMISKTGDVEALKLLGGPQGLREAATDAVKQWQYRPFEVKGHPVEVRTIIRVDVGSHATSSEPE